MGKGWGFGRVGVTVKVKVRKKVRAGYRVVTQEGRQGLQCHLREEGALRDMVGEFFFGLSLCQAAQ